MQGKSINGFTLQQLLGTGGMSEVWYAENKIRKKAAVKLLLPKLCQDENVVSRFLTEAKVMVELNHPNIRQVYDYDEIDDRPAIVMEYLEGDDLKTRMKNGQSFTHDELVKWWNQLVAALNYTHKKGIVHRDIKPGNIFVDEEGNIKLLDFGIAKVRESISSTQTGQKLGTLMYMSPEQVNDSKHIDYHTDIYSLAVTFVQLLTGKKPYDSDTSSDFQIMTSIVNKPLDLSGVPAQWRGFLEPYLEKEPSNRPALRYFEAVETDRCPSPKPDANLVQNVDGNSSKLDKTNTDNEATIAGDASTDNDATIGAVETDENPSQKLEKPALKKIFSEDWLWIVFSIMILLAIVFAIKLNRYKDYDSITNPPKPTNPTVPKDNVVEYQKQNVFENKSFTVNGITFEMIAVKGGTFTMGCTDEQSGDCWDSEKPAHSVTLSDYYIGKCEVTVAQFRAFINETNYRTDADKDGSSYVCNDSIWVDKNGVNWRCGVDGTPRSSSEDNHPVIHVSWNDANAYCEWLSGKTGMTFRLPTEAEWEYAARGGSKSNGYKYSGGNALDKVAWYADNSSDKTQQVGTKSPNELGIYDMSGNVWEWCQDWYGNYSGSAQINPTGPSSGSNRVLRGGVWCNFARSCRVSNRHYTSPDGRDCDLGFRIVLVP